MEQINCSEAVPINTGRDGEDQNNGYYGDEDTNENEDRERNGKFGSKEYNEEDERVVTALKSEKQ